MRGEGVEHHLASGARGWAHLLLLSETYSVACHSRVGQRCDLLGVLDNSLEGFSHLHLIEPQTCLCENLVQLDKAFNMAALLAKHIDFVVHPEFEVLFLGISLLDVA